MSRSLFPLAVRRKSGTTSDCNYLPKHFRQTKGIEFVSNSDFVSPSTSGAGECVGGKLDFITKGIKDVANHNTSTSGRWLHKAAEHGDAEAMYDLGCYYVQGNADLQIRPNMEAGKRWMKKAAAQGDSRAKDILKKTTEILDAKRQQR